MLEDTQLPPLGCERLLALADRAPRQAVALARRAVECAPAGDEVVAAWANYAHGWALLCWERFDEARPLLEGARDGFERAEVALGALRCRYALLQADTIERPRAALLLEFETLAGECAGAGALAEAVQTRLYQAVLLNMLGRPGEAVALLKQIELPSSETGGPAHARWLRVRAAAAAGLGEYAQAGELLQQAERLFAALRLRVDIAKCWHEQAWTAVRQERFAEALAFYLRAEQRFARLDLRFRQARCQKDSGYIFTLIGSYEQALASTLQALHFFSEIDATREIAGCQLHLGNIYLRTGRWEAALGCYIRAEDLFGAAGAVGDQLVAVRNRAMALREQRRTAEALALARSAEQQALALDNLAEAAEASHLLAGLLADAGQSEAALERYRDAAEQFTTIGNLPAAALCEVEAGWLLLGAGRAGLARARLEAAAEMLGEQPHHRWRIDYGLARCAEAHGDLVDALECYQRASATVAGLRAELLSEELSSGVYTQAAQLHADALACAARLGAGPALLALSEEQRALVFRRSLAAQAPPLPPALRPEHESLQRAIATLIADPVHSTAVVELDRVLLAYGELLIRSRHAMSTALDERLPQALPAFELARTRAVLNKRYGDDWTVLAYMLVFEQIWIIVVTADMLDISSVSLDAGLRRVLEHATAPAYRDYTYRDFALRLGRTARPWDTLASLAEYLLPETLLARLHPHHRLIVVPGGALHALPWAALRLGEHWLIERAIVQVVPSLASLPDLLVRQADLGAGALLIGCGSFGERAAPLPGVADELTAVASSLPGPHIRLLDSEAPCAALRDRSRNGELLGCGLLHIASHAQLLPARGLAAHLKLWDDDLWLAEVAELRLGGGLVVLSACDGAAADTLPGEEVLSLSWALLGAGAGTVLATLWPIYDRATVRFMQRFYAALLVEGDAAAALAITQRALIEQSVVDELLDAEPRIWTSFAAIGAGALVTTTGGTRPAAAP
jgi:CHAT domain-containing protein